MFLHTIANMYRSDVSTAQPVQISAKSLPAGSRTEVILIDVEAAAIQAHFQTWADTLGQVLEIRY